MAINFVTPLYAFHAFFHAVLEHLGLNCGHFLCSSRDTPSVCSVSAALREITILMQLVASFNKTF
jgi:hypothetical protein